jgi:hypothetical protein
MKQSNSFCQKLILFLFLVSVQFTKAQKVADGIFYQAIVRNNSGIPLTNQQVSVKLSIYSGSSTGTLQWEEVINTATDQNGLIKLIIGKGATTGSGASTSFGAINWSGNSFYLKLAIDKTGGTAYTDIGSTQLLSVPYAFYALSSDALTSFYLDQLADVNVPAPIAGKLLKWSGTFWIIANDKKSDTALFAYNSFHSIHADTSFYSYSLTIPDSVLFAYYSDTAKFAFNSSNAVKTAKAGHADTALYALKSAPIAWKMDGNTIGSATNALGTTDANDLVFKTNNTEMIRVSSAGTIQLASTATGFKLAMNGNDGMLLNGTFAAGTAINIGSGTRLHWYPKRAAFRAGGITATQWDDANMGDYSFATGYNSIASGLYSYASGNSSIASASYGSAFGRKAQAIGASESWAFGDSSAASTARSLVIGKGCSASVSNAAYAIGTYNVSTGAVSAAFGAHSTASGHYSIVFGYYGSSNQKTGSFVYADASSATVTKATANNQFLTRASGGTVFYTDPLNTMGVMLPAGGGSWASVSDKNKKENFKLVNAEETLAKVERLKITSWNYTSQDKTIRHIGLDPAYFYRAFHIGESNKTITDMDMDGITLLGIKALNDRLRSMAVLSTTEELESRLTAINHFTELNSRLDAIEYKLSKK